jgi:hypothetical protein
MVCSKKSIKIAISHKKESEDYDNCNTNSTI